MMKARRLIVAGIAALALATGLGSAALAAQSAPAATSALSVTSATSRMPSCSPGHLAIWVNQHGTKKAGVFYYRLEFTNLTGHSCWMRGYPGVLAEGLHGKRLGDPAVKVSGGIHMRGTILRPHKTAHALLGYRFRDIPLASCKAKWSSYLRVQEPQGWGVKTFFTKQVCSVRNGVKDLQVGLILPGL